MDRHQTNACLERHGRRRLQRWESHSLQPLAPTGQLQDAKLECRLLRGLYGNNAAKDLPTRKAHRRRTTRTGRDHNPPVRIGRGARLDSQTSHTPPRGTMESPPLAFSGHRANSSRPRAEEGPPTTNPAPPPGRWPYAGGRLPASSRDRVRPLSIEPESFRSHALATRK